MGLLAVFFAFDFAVNLLSALLKAVNEQGYLLKATTIAAVVFGTLLIVLPSPLDSAHLMAAFIATQAAWSLLLIFKVARRWMTTTARSAARQDAGVVARVGRLRLPAEAPERRSNGTELKSALVLAR